MLVLSRKIGESIKLAGDIEITVLAVDNLRVRLGIRAPRHIAVRRSIPGIEVMKDNQDAALHPRPAETKDVLSKAASENKKRD